VTVNVRNPAFFMNRFTISRVVT